MGFFIFDLIVLIVLILAVVQGYRKGFVLTLCGFLAVFVAFIGASILSDALAGPVSQAITPAIESGIQDTVGSYYQYTPPVEDSGDGVCFHVYCYNNQPGIAIDYATGESWLDGEEPQSSGSGAASSSAGSSSGETGAETEQHYVLNTNSKKFHQPDCSGVENMNPSNRQDYTGTRQSLLDQGYSPCGTCKP